MTDWRIVIPTRNSARYIGTFLDIYRANGLEPIYAIDGRSTDEPRKFCGIETRNFVWFTLAVNLGLRN